MQNFVLRHILAVLLALLILAPAAQGADIKRLVIAHDSNYQPFSYLSEDGTPQGYLVEFWNHFGKVNNTEIVFKLGTWQESMDMVKNGEADIHGGLFYSTERDEFLDYGPTITSLSTYLYVNKKTPLRESQICAVGVVEGGYTEYFMRTQRPNRRVAIYSQLNTLIQAAATEEIQTFLADQPTAVYHLRRFAIEDTFNPTEEFYSKTLRVAAKQGNSNVLEFIDSGWNKMDQNVLRVIQDKWFLKENENSNWIWTAAIIAFCALLVGIVFRKATHRIHKLD